MTSDEFQTKLAELAARQLILTEIVKWLTINQIASTPNPADMLRVLSEQLDQIIDARTPAGLSDVAIAEVMRKQKDSIVAAVRKRTVD